MKSPFGLFAAMLLLLSSLAAHAATSDDMLIYSDRLNNGLGTNWVNVAGSDQTNQVSVPVSTTNGAVCFWLCGLINQWC